MRRRHLPHRGGRAQLFVGGALLVALVAANIAGYAMSEELSREELRFEPPQWRLLQRLLTSTGTHETLVSSAIDLGPTDSGSSHVFRSKPIVTVRVGETYEYAPVSNAPLSDFTIHGPDGLHIDNTTGVISGVVNSPGLDTVTMEAQLANAQRVRQVFPLFVDDRVAPLGTDSHGRNVLRRLVLTMRYTLVPGLIAVLVSVIGGGLLGAYGGFSDGPVRLVLQGASAVLQSVPPMLLIFLAAILSEYNVYWTMLIVGLVLLPETAQGVMERVSSFRARDFVEAARELGMSDRVILWNEIIWHNTRTFLVSRLTQGLVFAVLIEVTLSYLQLSDPNTTRLGTMLLEGRMAWASGTASVLAFAPLMTLLLFVISLSLIERGMLRLWTRVQ